MSDEIVRTSNDDSVCLNQVYLDSPKSRKIPAWMVSCGFHFVLLCFLVLLFGISSERPLRDSIRRGDIVLIDISHDSRKYLNENDLLESLENSRPFSKLNAGATAEERPLDLAGVPIFIQGDPSDALAQSLEQLARKNGGQYLYKNIGTLTLH